MMRVNHLAVIVAAIVYFLLGGVWYGVIFKGSMSALTGMTQMAGGTTAYVVAALMSLVLAYVVGVALAGTSHPRPALHGIQFGLFMGIGVYASQLLTNLMFAGKSIALWAIDAGYVVIGMAIVGAIVGAWQKQTA